MLRLSMVPECCYQQPFVFLFWFNVCNLFQPSGLVSMVTAPERAPPRSVPICSLCFFNQHLVSRLRRKAWKSERKGPSHNSFMKTGPLKVVGCTSQDEICPHDPSHGENTLHWAPNCKNLGLGSQINDHTIENI